MRMPDCGPLGETLLEASERAIVDAFFLNSPAGGCVESVLTCATHFRFLARCAISLSIVHNQKAFAEPGSLRPRGPTAMSSVFRPLWQITTGGVGGAIQDWV